jgi:uncharacterized protein (DUF1330 family)
MTAYAIFIRESVTDPDAMAVYREKAGAAREGRTMETVVRGEPEVWEGPPAEAVLILKFPDIAQARAWYDSPAYQEARQHRLAGAEFRVMVLED